MENFSFKSLKKKLFPGTQGKSVKSLLDDVPKKKDDSSILEKEQKYLISTSKKQN